MRRHQDKWIESDRHGPRRRNLGALMAAGLFFAALPPFLEVFTDNERPEGIVSEVSAMTLLLILSAAQSPFARLAFMRERDLACFPAAERGWLTAAQRHAARITVALAAVILLWLWLASAFGWPAPTRPKHWFALGWSFLTIAAALPVFIAERTLAVDSD